MDKQTLICTGTCGFIASNLIRKITYEKVPYKVISIDNASKSSGINNIYANKNHKFYLGDITDEHFLNVVFEIEKPDIIVHMAASTAVDESISNPMKFVKDNVVGTQALLNAAVKWKTKLFFYQSTDEVYGQLGLNDPGWTEDSPLNPRNPYSSSKASGELLVQAAAYSYGLNYIISRSSNNYGPHQTADKLIPKVIKCILENQPIPIYGQGQQIRDWTHVFDNCSAILKMLETFSHTPGTGKGEIFNVSANQEFTNVEVVQEICNSLQFGHNLMKYITDPRSSHDFRYSLNCQKLKNIGWQPNFKFKNGIKSVVDWYSLNRYILK